MTSRTRALRAYGTAAKDPPTGATGTFTLTVSVRDTRGTICAITRDVRLEVTGGAVRISALDPHTLPLSLRPQVVLASLGADPASGGLLLEARPSLAGFPVRWRVSDGVVEACGERRARWRVPDAPGLYQAEVVLDCGDDGFAFDTLVIERGPPHQPG